MTEQQLPFDDPVANPDLPHITAYDPANPDPVPPADRLDNEPADVAAEDDTD
jgi:hypothetical protein